jgi:hypothetical protein
MENYSLRHVVYTWLLTILASPFVITIILPILNGEPAARSQDIFAFISLTMVFGVLFSLPALILYYLLAYILQRANWQTWLQKITLSVAGISLIGFSFLLMDKDFYENLNFFTRSLLITYCIIWVFGIILFFRNSSAINTSQNVAE